MCVCVCAERERERERKREREKERERERGEKVTYNKADKISTCALVSCLVFPQMQMTAVPSASFLARHAKQVFNVLKCG